MSEQTDFEKIFEFRARSDAPFTFSFIGSTENRNGSNIREAHQRHKEFDVLFFGSKWSELCNDWQCTAAPQTTGNLQAPSSSLRLPISATAERDLAQRMTQRLSSSPYVALHELRCECRDGVLTLHGRVPTFHTKQIALSLALDLEGVTAVIDRLEVMERTPNPSVA